MKTILAFVLIILSAAIYGQQEKFYRIFTKPDWDFADAVIERYDGNYLIAGSSRSQHSTDYDISLILVDSLGNTIWDKYLGQTDSMEFAYSLIETSDSNYLACGRIGNYFPYLALYDSSGQLIRDMRYTSGNSYYGAFSAGETADGNYYFIEPGPLFSLLYLVNPFGVVIWTKAYDYANCQAVIQTSDLGFMIVGFKEELFRGYTNIMIRTDQAGDTVWTKTIPKDGYYENISVLQLEDDGFIIAGTYDDPEIFDEDPTTLLIRTNSEGDTLWTKNHWVGTPNYIQECRYQSGYILSSRLWISPGGIYPDEYYLYITRLDTAGNMIWCQRFDGYTYNIGNNVTQTSDGGFLLTGHIQDVPFSSDAILIKLDSVGDYVLSTKDIDFPGLPEILTYPNPVKDFLYFRLPDPGMKIDEVRIFNIYGQEIPGRPVSSGHETALNVSGLAPGIYLYNLATGNNRLFKGKFLVTR